MANKIVQFTNASGDNIYPLAYAQGGVSLDLLWTNSDTARQGAGSATIDLTGYKFALVGALRYEYETSNILWTLIPVGRTGIIFSDNNKFRTFTVTTSNVSWDVANSQNYFQIPYQIYGIKMTYITPTEVHGLTYQED